MCKKIKYLLVPWLFFAILSIIFLVIDLNMTARSAVELLLPVARGCVRNEFFAGALWFLPCLFVMSVIFRVLTFWNNKIWIILSGWIMCLSAELLTGQDPSIHPVWLWNFDSALYYIIFFSTGYVFYPWMNQLFTQRNKRNSIILLISFVISGVIFAMVFFGHDPLKMLYSLPRGTTWGAILLSMVLVWFLVIVAWFFQNVWILAEIGKCSLYLCGNEWIIKTLFSKGLAIIGWEECLDSPLSACIYTLFLMWLVYKYVVPIEKQFLDKITNRNRIKKFTEVG